VLHLHSALTRNAYVNVHLNDGAGLSTIVAQGNIGSNVGSAEAKHIMLLPMELHLMF
jgi:hypothetical protein